VPCAHEDDQLLIADSWLVSDGRVRGLDRHRQRFFRACIEVAHVREEHLNAFWRATVRELPRHERWFPRVELSFRPRAELRLRIRPAPPQDAAVRLRAWDGPDRRTAPRRKGPDLAYLAEVRGRASTAGADDALLTTRSGLVLEATNSSVLWWEGPCLCMPSPALRILPGVTADLIQEIAARSGTRMSHRRRRVQDLNGCEIWLVNALHGIRTVSRWVGTSVVAGPAPRAPEWQARLEACAEPLPEHD
jgi:branched-subunit amino acid aminotransferase/4-amino-4-deoxychorismate lyase